MPTKKDELPQELTDRIAKEDNLADREMILGPLRKAKDYVVNKVKGIMPEKEPVKKAKGGMTMASKRGDGCAVRGKTKAGIK